MNIAVNTRLLLKGRLEGIGRFAHETLSRVTRQMPEHSFHFFFDRPYDKGFIYSDNVIGHSIFPPARHPILYNLWFHHALPRAMRKNEIDLLLSPEGYLPLNSSLPCINVIHDINFEHHPDLVPPKHSKHFRTYFPRYAKLATEIITVSEFSKKEIAQTYGVSADKISVVYNGVSDNFSPIPEDQQKITRNTFTNGDPYFVFVGSIHPRKNLVRLLKAFNDFKNTSNSNHKLVIVGNKAFMNDDLEQAYENMKYASDVVFTGRLEQSEMIRTLGSADALVFIPLYEGFGIPIIEAFKCNVPVITSDTSALPEIAGPAALFVDPYNIDSISSALKCLAKDKSRKNELADLGSARAEIFSWDSSAARIIEILNRTIDQT